MKTWDTDVIKIIEKTPHRAKKPRDEEGAINQAQVPTGGCQHGRQHSQCKDCGGSGFCEHGTRHSICKKGCGGSGIWEHGQERYRCKQCGGSGLCQHKKQRASCKECVKVCEQAAADRKEQATLGHLAEMFPALLEQMAKEGIDITV